ncbi:LidA [Legionella norrlandica]|uniref:LidA n=1 Tax=Legionella norrlandica TaxID=1498499 RepID=A0A0A2SWR6_9GAMM|nr:hypothetical protein [Legionella norrlandica]KGP64176.1 LidA [Legionella norrlandica]
MVKKSKSPEVHTAKAHTKSQEKEHTQKPTTVEQVPIENNKQISAKDSNREEKSYASDTKKEIKDKESVKPFKTSFEKWIESSLLDPQAKEDSGSTINLGREGLKNSFQVKKFLMSPAGIEVVNEISHHIVLEKNILLQHQEKIQEHELFMRRLKAALFLWYLSEKSEAAEKVKEIIHDQNEKAIKDAGKTSTPSSTQPSSTQQNEALQSMLREYDDLIKRAQENAAKREDLEKNLNKLERQGKEIEDKYDLYEQEASTEELDSFLVDTEDLSLDEIEERMEFFSRDGDKLMQLMSKHQGDEQMTQSLQREHDGIKMKLAALQVMRDVHKGEKSFVNEKGEPASLKDAKLIINKNQEVIGHNGQFYLVQKGQWDAIKGNSEALEKAEKDYANAQKDMVGIKLEATIQRLTLKMEEQLEELNNFIISRDPADNEKVPELMQRHNGANLKLANLQDMLAVHRGEKRFIDAKGNPVDSLKEAEFVIGKEQKLAEIDGKFYPIHQEQRILEKDGKFYLLNQNENWESIEHSPEKQKQAEQAFDRLKYETPMTVKKLVHHNRGLETTVHKGRVEEARQQVQDNKKEGLEIANSISKYQATMSNALSQMNQPNLSQDTPTLSPSGGSTSASSPKPTPSLASVTMFFKAKIEEMKNSETSGLTRDQLKKLQLQNQIPAGPARNYYTLAMNQLPRKGPIPFQMMQSLLRNLERFGVDTTKPSVTSIQSETDKAQEQRYNPFDITPTPFKAS